MRCLSDASSEPGRKLRCCSNKLVERLGGQFAPDVHEGLVRSLRPQPGERAYSDAGRPAGEGQLPARDMLKLDLLASDVHCPAAPGGQVDGANRNLRREPQGIGGGRSIRTDDFATLMCDGLYRLLDSRRPGPEPGFDGFNVDPTPSPDQFSRVKVISVC